MENIFLFFTLISFTIAWRPTLIGDKSSPVFLENSLKSFRAGFNKYRYDGFRLDVKITKDEKYIIWSEDSVEPAEKDSKRLEIKDLTLSELQNLTIKKRRGSEENTGKIATLEEVLKLTSEEEKYVVFELKHTKGLTSGDMGKFPGIIELVRKYNLEEKTYILSSNRQILEYVRDKYPNLKLQYQCYSFDIRSLDWLEKYKIDPMIRGGRFSYEDCKTVRGIGRDVAAFDIKKKEDYTKNAKMGVYMLIVDEVKKRDLEQIEYLSWKTNPDL